VGSDGEEKGERQRHVSLEVGVRSAVPTEIVVSKGIAQQEMLWALSRFKLFMELGCRILIRVVTIRSRFRGRVHANRSVNTTTKTRSDCNDPYKDPTAQLHK